MIQLSSKTVSAPGFERVFALGLIAVVLATAFVVLKPVRPFLVGGFALVGLGSVLSTALRPSMPRPDQPSSDAVESQPASMEPRLESTADILEWALLQAMELSGGTTGSIMLLDQETGTLRIAAARGLPADVVSGTSVRPGEGIAGLVLESGRPLIVEDSPYRSSPRRGDVRSAVSVPMSHDSFVVGVLNVGRPHHPARLTDDQVEELRVLGSRIATSLAEGDRAIESIMESL